MKTITAGLLVGLILFVPVTQALAKSENFIPEDEKKCLIDNVYHEARGVTEQEQIAIAHVVMNRVRSSKFPDTICKTVYQVTPGKKGKKVRQFSWTHSNVIKERLTYEKIRIMIEQKVIPNLDKPTTDALFFSKGKGSCSKKRGKFCHNFR
jgi:spore germination cell wall hydrolase CwlJ-like protein